MYHLYSPLCCVSHGWNAVCCYTRLFSTCTTSFVTTCIMCSLYTSNATLVCEIVFYCGCMTTGYNNYVCNYIIILLARVVNVFTLLPLERLYASYDPPLLCITPACHLILLSLSLFLSHSLLGIINNTLLTVSSVSMQ